MNIREEFEENGLVQLNGLFSHLEVKNIKRTIEEIADQLPRKSNLSKNGLKFYSNLYRKSDFLRMCLSNPLLSETLFELSESDVWLRWDQCVIKEPNGETFPLHRDNVYSKLKSVHFQVWIALTEMNETNGSLQFIKGSHKDPEVLHVHDNHHWRAERDERPLQYAKAQLGDVIIFSSRLLHATGINQSSDSRWAYVAEYLPVHISDPNVNAPFWVLSQKEESPSGSWVDEIGTDEDELLADQTIPKWKFWKNNKRVRKV